MAPRFLLTRMLRRHPRAMILPQLHRSSQEPRRSHCRNGVPSCRPHPRKVFDPCTPLALPAWQPLWPCPCPSGSSVLPMRSPQPRQPPRIPLRGLRPPSTLLRLPLPQRRPPPLWRVPPPRRPPPRQLSRILRAFRPPPRFPPSRFPRRRTPRPRIRPRSRKPPGSTSPPICVPEPARSSVPWAGSRRPPGSSSMARSATAGPQSATATPMPGSPPALSPPTSREPCGPTSPPTCAPAHRPASAPWDGRGLQRRSSSVAPSATAGPQFSTRAARHGFPPTP